MKLVKVMSIVGARPQFVKLAPVERALLALKRDDMQISSVVVHTGQHYDDIMSKVFFEELKLPAPAINLGIGSGTHAEQTGRILIALEKVLQDQCPDVVVVYGDTNSTLAGVLAASKLHIPTAHVEAGLRSFNRGMPEEQNRIATDHLADLLLAPTPTAIKNLEREGLGSRALYCGDVMFDAVIHNKQLARQHSSVLGRLPFGSGEYGLVTIHRAENTEPLRLRSLLDSLNDVAKAHMPLIFPVHPRTAAVLRSNLGGWIPHERLKLIEPLGHLDMLAAIENSRVVLTDSGGLQKEAVFLGRACLTLREETEWLETLERNQNVLVGSDGRHLLREISRLGTQVSPSFSESEIGAIYGGGRASAVIAQSLASLVIAH